MSRAVKARRYRSPLRDQQAARTRRAIVDAAAAVFTAQGYAGASLDAIAAHAGVSRATVFAAVGGKPALLTAAYRAAFGRAAGAEEDALPLVERPRSREIRAQRTVAAYLDGYVSLAVTLGRHLCGVHEAAREGARIDDEVAVLWREVNDQRRRGAHTIVADVRARAPLRTDLTAAEAEDVVWVLNDPALYAKLVRERGWPEPRFEAWLRRAFETELLDPGRRKR